MPSPSSRLQCRQSNDMTLDRRRAEHCCNLNKDITEASKSLAELETSCPQNTTHTLTGPPTALHHKIIIPHAVCASNAMFEEPQTASYFYHSPHGVHRPQTTDRRPQTADLGPQTSGCKPWTADRRRTDFVYTLNLNTHTHTHAHAHTTLSLFLRVDCGCLCVCCCLAIGLD